MVQTASLFARKLRDWRARNGTHGRVTQEGLAELLGVSVEAISKYERSLSFIRGDLEQRLSENLGWTSADILACRTDWEVRQRRHKDATPYRLLDDTIVSELYNGSWRDAARASIDLACASIPSIHDDFAANDSVFGPIYDTYRDHWCAVLHNDQMVAKWALPFLLPEDEARLRAGTLVEIELSVDRIRKPILPGHYFGYCPALIVAPGHQAASSLLLSSFIDFLETQARSGNLLHGFGSITCSPAGEQVCRDLGMTFLRRHQVETSYGVWELTGAGLSRSIFARRSPLLQQCYSEAFGSAP